MFHPSGLGLITLWPVPVADNVDNSLSAILFARISYSSSTMIFSTIPPLLDGRIPHNSTSPIALGRA
jgi:hypothetical protein